MHVSGILVVVRPGEVGTAALRLEALPGVEVHHRDPDGGRLVVVLESPDLQGQEEGLRRIQRLPGVLTAALVAHRSEELGPGDRSP
jgi:nitrate reductase NapD